MAALQGRFATFWQEAEVGFGRILLKNSRLIGWAIADSIPLLIGDFAMMGARQEAQAALLYKFSLEDHVPQDHLLRSIDRFVDLDDIRQYLPDFYSHTGRPILLRYQIRAPVVRRGAFEPRLSLVLSS